VNLLAVYGSPRRNGNTVQLLGKAVKGARDGGAYVREVILRDRRISPCLEIYGCRETGRCVIQDDFQELYDELVSVDGLMLASPIFFYTVSAHTKAFMDRCQSLWVKKYWIDRARFGERRSAKKGLFIAAGATGGKKLFDGALLTARYFFDALDMELWRAVLVKGVDSEGDVLKRPDALDDAYRGGLELALALRDPAPHSV